MARNPIRQCLDVIQRLKNRWRLCPSAGPAETSGPAADRRHDPPIGPDGDSDSAPHQIERRRYRRVRWFFTKVFLQIILWDTLFTLPVLQFFRPDPLPRWQSVARRFREMAAELGGVLIKMGQFLSIRVDIFPAAVIRELSGLQDEVAPERFEHIAEQIEADFGRPLDRVFAFFASAPLGSASLAQAHLARLHSGEEAVVKVLRPGIHRLVQTDLSAMRLVCRWLSFFRHIRSRVNLERLMTEFTATTLAELDLAREAENILRFAADFADDPHVYIPRVYRDCSIGRTLTLENVFYFKIADIKAIQACGISCSDVAAKLYDIYMKQIFTTNFVHIDPHPGNLFVRPLPDQDELDRGKTGFNPGEPVPCSENRPFQIVFIDFGMTAVISERLKAAMRMGAIGIASQDVRKVIQAYVVAGILQPGTDLRRMEEAHEDWLQRIWGLRMGKIQEVIFRETRYFIRQYRDLIRETPFQLQADMLFIGRAVGILAGMATTLNPEFDPWQQTIPHARRFTQEELKAEWQGATEELFQLGRHILKIPSRLDHVLTKAGQGSLVMQVSLSPETRKAIRRIDISVKRFSWMVIAAGLLVSGVNLHIAGKDPVLSLLLTGFAILAFLWGLRKV